MRYWLVLFVQIILLGVTHSTVLAEETIKLSETGLEVDEYKNIMVVAGVEYISNKMELTLEKADILKTVYSRLRSSSLRVKSVDDKEKGFLCCYALVFDSFIAIEMYYTRNVYYMADEDLYKILGIVWSETRFVVDFESPDEIMNAVANLTELFINDYLAANTKQ